MRVLEGGCQVPIGAHAITTGDTFTINAMVAKTDGSKVIRAAAQGSPARSLELAQAVVDDLLSQGATDILESAREQAGEDGSVTPLY